MNETMIPIMHPHLPTAAALRPYLEEIDREGWYSNFGPLERRLENRLAVQYGVPPENVHTTSAPALTQRATVP